MPNFFDRIPFKKQLATAALIGKLFASEPGCAPDEDVKTRNTATETDTTPEVAAKPERKVVPQKYADKDAMERDNQDFIERNCIDVAEETVEVGKELFVIKVYSKKGAKPPTEKYLVPHDSEDQAFDTGLRKIKDGGILVTLESNNNRNLYSIKPKQYILTKQDPNRMFNPENKYWPVAKKILELLGVDDGKMVIALHNNTGKGYHINYLRKTRQNLTIMSEADTKNGDGNMVWVPGRTVRPDTDTQKEIDYYREQGLNVVYELVPEVGGDGSFSNYAAQHGIPYRNLEIKVPARKSTKALADQIRYTDAVLTYRLQQGIGGNTVAQM